MSFQEVQSIEDMKTEYRRLVRKYDSLRSNLIEKLTFDDLEQLQLYDFFELKETYNQKKTLYWKIHALEHPNDTASKIAYDFLNSMTSRESVHWLQAHGLTTHQLIAEISNNPNFLTEVEA